MKTYRSRVIHGDRRVTSPDHRRVPPVPWPPMRLRFPARIPGAEGQRSPPGLWGYPRKGSVPLGERIL